jgi:hypothetical protein
MCRQTMKTALPLLCLVGILVCPVAAWADYYGNSPNLPPLDGQYVSVDQWHAFYAMGIVLTNVVHKGFTDSFPPPPPGMTDVHTFGSQVEGYVSFDGGVTFQPFSTAGPTTVKIYGELGSGSTSHYDTEMLGMNLSGGSLPMGVMIRESPILASTGLTDITDLGDGTYHIDSFFDVFTELSLDGGMSWYPDMTGPGRMNLVPEPSCLAILVSGLLGLWVLNRRNHK